MSGHSHSSCVENFEFLGTVCLFDLYCDSVSPYAVQIADIGSKSASVYIVGFSECRSMWIPSRLFIHIWVCLSSSRPHERFSRIVVLLADGSAYEQLPYSSSEWYDTSRETCEDIHH